MIKKKYMAQNFNFFSSFHAYILSRFLILKIDDFESISFINVNNSILSVPNFLHIRCLQSSAANFNLNSNIFFLLFDFFPWSSSFKINSSSFLSKILENKFISCLLCELSWGQRNDWETYILTFGIEQKVSPEGREMAVNWK